MYSTGAYSKDSSKDSQECKTIEVGTGPEDAVSLEAARKGCVKYYGEGACLVKFIKRGDRNYYAICRRLQK